MARHHIVVLAALSVVGCTSSSHDGPCDSNDDCPAGSVCAYDECVLLCTVDGDCEPGQVCDGDMCTTGGRDTPPNILSVDGNGTIDGAAGHAEHYFRDRLVVTGQNLAGATLTLEPDPPSGDPLTLEICPGGTSARIEAVLPFSLGEGSYLLAAQNQAGSCEVSVNILQGEPGVAGVPIPGTVSFFDLPTCPQGWSELSAAQGRYLVGLAAGGTLGGAVGTALGPGENRDVARHQHTGTTATAGSHMHDVKKQQFALASGVELNVINASGTLRTADNMYPAGDHTHTFTSANAGSVAGTNSPYLQLLVCRKD